MHRTHKTKDVLKCNKWYPWVTQYIGKVSLNTQVHTLKTDFWTFSRSPQRRVIGSGQDSCPLRHCVVLA